MSPLMIPIQECSVSGGTSEPTPYKDSTQTKPPHPSSNAKRLAHALLLGLLVQGLGIQGSCAGKFREVSRSFVFDF